MAHGARPLAAHPDDDGQDAAALRALESRVYGGDEPDPADVDELRRLITKASSQPSVDEAEPGVQDHETGRLDRHTAAARSPLVARIALRPRAWFAGALVVVVLAGAVGAGLGVGILRSSNSSGTGMPVTVRSIGSGADTSSRLEPAAQAEALGAQYFDQKQTGGDRPAVQLPRIDATTTRRVLAQFGQSDGEAGVWVARGTDGSFCLIMAVGTSRAASSCTPEADVVSTGVHLDMAVTGDGSISATWNLASGLLELSPFPSGADTQSGGGNSTP